MRHDLWVRKHGPNDRNHTILHLFERQRQRQWQQQRQSQCNALNLNESFQQQMIIKMLGMECSFR